MKEHKGKWGGSTAIIIGLVAAVLSSGNTTDSPKKGSDATPPAASAPANPGPSTAPAPSPRTAPATPETPTQAFLAEVNRRLNPDNHTEAHCNERIAYFENNPNAVEGEMAAPEALLRWRQNRTFVRRVGQVRAIVAHIEAGQLDRLEEYADVALNPHNQDRAYFEGLRGNRNYGAIVDRSLAELELKPRLLQMIRQARAARSEDR